MISRGRTAACGLTLIELMVGLAIMAILATLAVPEFGRQVTRWQLRAGAERLASDLSDARFDAVKLGRAQHVRVSPGKQACWAVSDLPACDCGQVQQCQRHRHLLNQRGNLTLEGGTQVRFEPTADARSTAERINLRTRYGDRLQVVLGPMGRPRVCGPDEALLGYARC